MWSNISDCVNLIEKGQTTNSPLGVATSTKSFLSELPKGLQPLGSSLCRGTSL